MTWPLIVCRECHKPIDMLQIGAVCVGAHSRTFCSMRCADTWESNPENEEAVRASYATVQPSVAEILDFAYESCIFSANERIPHSIGCTNTGKGLVSYCEDGWCCERARDFIKKEATQQ